MIRAVGLIAGTSLDGIDAALVALGPSPKGYAFALERFITVPFSPELRTRMEAALPPQQPSPRAVAELDAALGAAFGDAAATVARGAAVDFIASHGVTLYHDGSVPVTVQIADPFAIRERTGVTVVADFRRADTAAGGQGAPLVPHADALLFAAAGDDVTALNLGGIANVTVLARGEAPRAWDTGPANMPLDAFVRARTCGAERFDRDGAYGMRGTVDVSVVSALLDGDPYLALAPPKSTGREHYGATFERRAEPLVRALSLEDGCATLAAFVARTVADALHAHAPRTNLVVASGGGVHNARLVRELADAFGSRRAFATSAAFGVDPDAKEALAFALLGCETLRGRAGARASVTGARHDALLGAIAPYDLAALLRRIEAAFGPLDGGR